MDRSADWSGFDAHEAFGKIFSRYCRKKYAVVPHMIELYYYSFSSEGTYTFGYFYFKDVEKS
ncbi:MAG: hypothetical protein K2X86_09560 [Cytophagaceae bacterium]|nr:hypothetical protein [Cytophagaceae bacterium]